MDAKEFFRDKNILKILLLDTGEVSVNIKDNIEQYVVTPKYEKR